MGTTNPFAYEAIDLAKLIEKNQSRDDSLCKRLVRLATAVRDWEALVVRAVNLPLSEPGRMGLIVANAIELGRAKRDLENASV